MISDSTTHRGTLFQMVKVAQAVITADGPTPDLARLRDTMPALRVAISRAAAFARTENHSQGRAAWPMLAKACLLALHHISADDGSAPVRETVTRWKTIVGALLPLASADWQAWRDATAPKLGSSAPAPIVAAGDSLDPRAHFECYAAPRGYDLTRYTAGEYRHPDTREAWGLFQFAAHSLAQEVERLKLDIRAAECLQDSAYKAGMRAGWNFAVADDEDGYRIRMEDTAYLAELKQVKAERAALFPISKEGKS